MERKPASGILLAMLTLSMLALALNIQPAKAIGTIYIKADGSVDPDTAPISSMDNVTYTFTDNINDAIVVQRNNIIIDGNGHTLQGSGGGYGFYLYGRNGVTIRNATITEWYQGFYLYSCIGNTISHNSITNNYYGVELSANNDYNTVCNNSISDNERGVFLYRYDDNNVIADNSLTDNWYGIYLFASDRNTLSGNSIANSFRGIYLYWYNDENTISCNSIDSNQYGVHIEWYNYGNTIYHNNIIDNVYQAVDQDPAGNNWHNPELLEGNYWSDYPGVDDGSGTGKHAIAGDGIGDTDIPWFNDFYPLMAPRISDVIGTSQELIETIESWDIPKGTQNSLVVKLDEAIDLWNRGNTNGAIHKIIDLIKQVTNDRKNLTEDQKSYLLLWANAVLTAMISGTNG